MPARKDRIELTCAKCGRTARVTVQVLARQRGCGYCGHEYELSGVVREALAAFASGGGEVRTTGAVSVECPICAKVTKFNAQHASGTTRCAFCGCRIQVSPTGGPPLAVPPPERRFASKVGSTVGGPCPSCRKDRLRIADADGRRATCEGCGAAHPLSGVPLLAALGMSATPASEPFRRFAWQALDARWRRGDLGVTEAWAVADPLQALERRGSTVSPFGADLTLEIVQWALLGAPDAVRGRSGDVVFLEVELHDWGGTSRAATDVGTAILEFGVAAALGDQFQLRNPDEQARELPLLRIVAAPDGLGADLHVEVRQPGGSVTAAPPGVQARTLLLLAGRLHRAACRMLAFKALFGAWTTGSMFYCASEQGVLRRIESLGPPLCSEAARWTGEIRHRVDVTEKDLTG